MKRITVIVLLALLIAPMNAAPADAAPRDRPANVVFFLVDDLGWRDLGCYGSAFHETPHVDGFARQSVRFTHAYAACHVCSPTRASILTGKYPARLGLTDWLPGRKDFPFQRLKNAPVRQQLPVEETTLAEALKARGYATGCFGKWHLGEEPAGPRQHGFDVQVPRWNKGWPRAGYHAPFRLDGLDDEPGDYLTDRLTDEALRFIDDHRDGPFFLYLSHFAVHDPIQGPPDLVEKYRAKLARTPAPPEAPPFILEANPDSDNPLSRTELAGLLERDAYRGYRVLPQRTVKIKQRQDNAEFAAMVEAMDRSFGRVLAKLDALGLSDDTLVIFFSDNGGMSAANFGRPDRVIAPGNLDAAFSTANLPLRGGKGWLYEGGIRVPLLIRAPAGGAGATADAAADAAGDAPQTRGVVCDTPVISTDFYPTILDLLGLPALPDQHADGVSLVPLLRGQTRLGRDAIYWHFPHYSNHGMQSPAAAIRRGDLKLIEYFENGTAQLFNLRADPAEQHDLSADQPKQAQELRRMLHRWREQVSAATMQTNPRWRPQ